MNKINILENGTEKEIDIFEVISNSSEVTFSRNTIKDCLNDWKHFSILNRNHDIDYSTQINTAFVNLIVCCYNKYKLTATINSVKSDNILKDESLFNTFVEVVFVSLNTMQNLESFEKYFSKNLYNKFSKISKLTQFEIMEVAHV